MPDVLRSMEVGGSIGVSIVRLIAALAMGTLVAVIYKWARSSEASSFTATLVWALTPAQLRRLAD